MPRLLTRAVPGLAPAAAVIVLLTALPPVGSYARQYAFVQAAQFVIFAVGAPALLLFITLVISWRPPAVLATLARYPALTGAEIITLVCAGSAVWIELVATPQLPQLPRPMRAAMAAVAMWSIWAVAYVTGMSGARSAGVGLTPTSTIGHVHRVAGAVTLRLWLGDILR